MSLPQETAAMQPTSTTPTPSPASTPATETPSAATTTSTPLYQTYHTQIENLKRLPVPYSDIYHALSSYDTIPLRTIHERFRSASTDLTAWLENAEMAVFALEMDVDQDGAADKRDVGGMDVIMNRFQPNVDMLIELKEKIEQRLKASSFAEQEEVASLQIEQDLNQTIQGIKSSWDALKQMLEKVKGDLAGARLRAELLTHMDSVLADIGDICTSIDGYNNERSAMTSDEEGLLPSRISSSDVDQQAKQRSLETLAQVDSRIELLIARIDFLDTRVGSLPKDEVSIGNESKDALHSRYQQVLCRWDDLKFRRERVSEELKDDKWLEVFEQVAEQVESMMESIERAVVHCQGLLDHIKLMVRNKVVPDAPIDREHLYSIFKSFEAKHKYYTPAVNQMLEMLENGIESRTTRNMDVISRHQAMNVKWDRLEDGLERVDRELDDVERLLDILDTSRTPYLPKVPLKKPEPATNTAKRAAGTSLKPGWNSSTVQPKGAAARGQQAGRQTPQQSQRGRQPVSNTLRSPAQSRQRSRTRSPDGFYDYQRPWSPANSTSSLSQSGVLTSAALNSYRSLSPSPTRGNYRARPCVGQNRLESPAPSGRQSAMSNGSRSGTTTPSLLKTPSQIKPVFSPSGSNSKLSTGLRSNVSSPTPTPAGRKTQLPMPASRQGNQRASMTPSPQMQRYGREAPSPIPSNYSGSSQSSRMPTSSTMTAGRQRQFSANGSTQGYGGGYGGRTSPVSSRQGHYYDDRSQPSYNTRPGSAAGSTSSLGRDYYGYEEPLSPSISSVSSITSSTRQYQYGRGEQALPELMDRMKVQIDDVEPYHPTRGDELDEEFAKVVNASPIQMQVRRLGEGKYYFGGHLDAQGTSLVGGKMALCRLMEYGRISGEDDSGVSSGGSHSGTDDGFHPSGLRQANRRNPAGSLAALQAEEAQRDGKKRPRKVLVRVGGGWQDLDIFLLDHSKLATETSVRAY